MRLRKVAKAARRRPVLVVWLDSGGHSGWVADEHCNCRPLRIYTLGWLIRKTAQALTVASSATSKGDEGQSQAPIAIPRCAVLSWRYLDRA